MDAHDATDCPAVDAYRQSLIDGSPIAAPASLTDCPPDFGNLDIYSGSFPDPTPRRPIALAVRGLPGIIAARPRQPVATPTSLIRLHRERPQRDPRHPT